MSAAYDQAIMRDGPWSYLPMDEDSGLPRDLTGNGRGGNGFNGTITYRCPPAAPGLNPGIRFGGSSPAMGMAAPPIGNLASGGAWSVEMWMQYETLEGSNTVFWESWAGSQNRTQVGLASFSVRTSNGSQGGAGVEFNRPAAGVGNATGVHLAVTMAGDSTTTWYVDGQAHATALYGNGTRQTSSGAGRLGRSQDTFWGTNQGVYSNFAFYTFVLSPDRIAEHYRIGMGRLPRLRSLVRSP